MSYSCTQASEYSLHSFRHAINCDTKPKELSSFIVYVTAFFAPRGGWNETDLFLQLWPVESEINDKANISITTPRSICRIVYLCMHFFFFFLVRRLSKKNAQCGQSSWLIRREACLHLLKTCCWCLCFWPLNQRLVHQVWSETSLSEIHKKLNCMSESHMNLLFCFAFCSPSAFDAYTRSVSEAAGKHLWFVCNIIRLAYTGDTARRCQSMLAPL